MEYRLIAALLIATLAGACSATPTGLESSDAATSGSRASPVVESPPCPAQTFEEFLQAFAADDQVRDRFTAAEVLVTDWRDPNETQEGTEVTAVAKADYRNFTIRYQNGAFHDVAPDGTVDPEPTDVEIVRSGDSYLVSYVYGLSEGNSWRFDPKDACWHLAEDPEASDP